MSKGLLLVISGPSGCGKGTICNELRRRRPEIKVSISVTTREIRAGEQDGVNYFYRTKDQFLEMIQENELLEYAQIYNGQYYGTPKKYVKDTLIIGDDIILEIDIQGALQVKERFDEGVFIFIVPPSMEELKRRLVARGTETKEAVLERFTSAYSELNFVNRYNYVVINDELDKAVDAIEAIITAEKCRVSRNTQLQSELLGGNVL